MDRDDPQQVIAEENISLVKVKLHPMLETKKPARINPRMRPGPTDGMLLVTKVNTLRHLLASRGRDRARDRV
jgi:hypothetical protein